MKKLFILVTSVLFILTANLRDSVLCVPVPENSVQNPIIQKQNFNTVNQEVTEQGSLLNKRTEQEQTQPKTENKNTTTAPE